MYTEYQIHRHIPLSSFFFSNLNAVLQQKYPFWQRYKNLSWRCVVKDKRKILFMLTLHCGACRVKASAWPLSVPLLISATLQQNTLKAAPSPEKSIRLLSRGNSPPHRSNQLEGPTFPLTVQAASMVLQREPQVGSEFRT